jgi:hypothetical protein
MPARVRPRRALRPALLAVSLSLACVAHAQSGTDAPARARSATELDAVKVIAERTHTDTGALGDRAVRDTPFAISVVGREDIGSVPQLEGLSLYSLARYYGDVYYDADNTLKLPEYTLVNAGVGYRMQANGYPITWRATVENLTNKKYWSNAGIGLPRTFAVSVRFDL